MKIKKKYEIDNILILILKREFKEKDETIIIEEDLGAEIFKEVRRVLEKYKSKKIIIKLSEIDYIDPCGFAKLVEAKIETKSFSGDLVLTYCNSEIEMKIAEYDLNSTLKNFRTQEGAITYLNDIQLTF